MDPLNRDTSTQQAQAGSAQDRASATHNSDAVTRDTAQREQRRAELAHNLRETRYRIAVAGGADLLVITKFHPVEDLMLLKELGIDAVGENREQEARAKAETLSAHTDTPMNIHMVGQIQRKKANHIARWAAAVHTIDSAKLIDALDRGVQAARDAGHRTGTLPVLLQYSADGDPERGGATAEDIDALADQVAAAPQLELRGLMTVPPLGMEARRVFAQGKALLDSIEDRIVGVPVYSAGMSADMECAIAEGSTLVRVGTGIMGQRALA